MSMHLHNLALKDITKIFTSQMICLESALKQVSIKEVIRDIDEVTLATYQ